MLEQSGDHDYWSREMRTLCVILFDVASLSVAFAAHAAVDPHCLQSFAVNNISVVPIGSESIRCVEVEKYRETLFKRIDQMSTQQNQQLLRAKESLDKMQGELDKIASASGSVPAVDIASNFIATVGLSACLKANEAGCIMAVVGKVLGEFSLISSQSSESVRKSAISNLRQQLGDARTQIDGAGAGDVANALTQTVNEFNAMCASVRQTCMKHP